MDEQVIVYYDTCYTLKNQGKSDYLAGFAHYRAASNQNSA